MNNNDNLNNNNNLTNENVANVWSVNLSKSYTLKNVKTLSNLEKAEQYIFDVANGKILPNRRLLIEARRTLASQERNPMAMFNKPKGRRRMRKTRKQRRNSNNI